MPAWGADGENQTLGRTTDFRTLTDDRATTVVALLKAILATQEEGGEAYEVLKGIKRELYLLRLGMIAAGACKDVPDR